MAHMKAAHTAVETVGRITQEAGVKTAAKYCKGEVIVGKDLMVI
jgi:hypothetical protein